MPFVVTDSADAEPDITKQLIQGDKFQLLYVVLCT